MNASDQRLREALTQIATNVICLIGNVTTSSFCVKIRKKDVVASRPDTVACLVAEGCGCNAMFTFIASLS